ncbi:MAG: acyl-CoA thioesterase [Oleiphilus sp.]|nr:MAG: acyl-CoA thioesterase [Oleiphilus sp.]
MESTQSPLHWQRPNPYTQVIRVSPEDTDRLGHTNNVRYLAWLEQIAWMHITSLGCGWDEMEQAGYAMAITRTEIDYRAASYANDSLVLGTWITENDRRFTCARAFELIRESDRKTLLTASMRFACINLNNGHPARMPELFILALERGMLSSFTSQT